MAFIMTRRGTQTTPSGATPCLSLAVHEHLVRLAEALPGHLRQRRPLLHGAVQQDPLVVLPVYRQVEVDEERLR